MMNELESRVIELREGGIYGLSINMESEVSVICQLVGNHWLPLYGLKHNSPIALPPCFALSDQAERGLNEVLESKRVHTEQ